MPHASPLPPDLATGPFVVSATGAPGISRRRARALDLSAPFRGIRTAEPPSDVVDLCRAYAIRMPQTQYFSHATAAIVWGIPLPLRLERDRTLHVSAAPGSREPRMRGVTGHRGAAGATRWRLGSIVVASACDSWCQIVSELTEEEAIVAGDRIVGWPRPLATLDELDAAIARFGSRRGARRISQARPHIRENSASARETTLRLTTLRAGFPEPEPNGAITLSSGRITHGDLVYRRYKVLLEYDGEQHRLDAAQFATDVNRLNDLSEDGWIVIRVGKHLSNDDVLVRLDRALRSRGWRP